MASAVKSQAADLRAKSYFELLGLPAMDSRRVEMSGKIVTFTVFRVIQSQHQLLVVVQALRDRLAGLSTEVYVSGFVASANGELVDATETLLWDYS